MLLRTALDQGARHVPASVRSVALASAESVIAYESADDAGQIRARWVLDCSGRAGVIAKTGWRLGEQAERTTALIGVWDRADGWPELPDATHTVVESYEGGWAWSVPSSRTRRYVTVMV